MRGGFLIALLVLAVLPLPSVAQTFDARTGVMELPGSPLSPTSDAQCDGLQRQWSQLSQALEDAHQKCLDAHQRETEDPRASMSATNPVCSHPACQSLHTARFEVGQKSRERVQACRSEVAQYQQRKQLERQQAELAERQQQERAAAARNAAEQQFELAQQVEENRREAAERMAEVLGQHADELRQMVAARQNAQFGPPSLAPSPLAPSTLAPASGEFTTDSPATDSPAQEVLLDPAANVVRMGNPPGNMTQLWQVGQTRSQADGYYDTYVYVWQFSTPDSQLCPIVSIGDGSVAREALFQETAIEHYQVSQGVVIRSNLEKRKGFLRCLSPGETAGYPKYRVFPFGTKTQGDAMGTRG
jgi:hypothetical protein